MMGARLEKCPRLKLFWVCGKLLPIDTKEPIDTGETIRAAQFILDWPSHFKTRGRL
jgi:hypothetical protein